MTDYNRATSQIAQTTLRSVLGQSSLDDLLAERDKINEQLQQIIDEQTEPWGVKVSIVEVKDVELPQTMQRAMARQAEAEREKRAKVIHAEGELEASQKLAQAAVVIDQNPVTHPASLPADADRDRRGEEHDRRLPLADRHHLRVLSRAVAQRERRDAFILGSQSSNREGAPDPCRRRKRGAHRLTSTKTAAMDGRSNDADVEPKWQLASRNAVFPAGSSIASYDPCSTALAHLRIVPRARRTPWSSPTSGVCRRTALLGSPCTSDRSGAAPLIRRHP